MANHARLSSLFTCAAVLTLAIPQALAQSESEAAPLAAGPVDTVESGAGGGGVTPQYGGALRLRWVSVPSWFLKAFTKENTPLSSYHTGVEFQRRKGDLDIVVGLSYQDMSPPDGNWLGKNKDPAIDVDYVQFKDLSIWTLDVAFVWNHWVNDYFSFRYGAGLGLGVVGGKILRTSAGSPGGPNGGCTPQNQGNEGECKPQLTPPCAPGLPCTDSQLAVTEGMQDRGPTQPHRFKEKDVPGAIPVLNIVFGPVLTFPDLPGFEARLEAGWFDAFFAGIALSYSK